MATFVRTNSSSSISSFSSVGSDNAEVGRAGKAGREVLKNKNLVQRTRDALGDIGNRLKKNPVVLGGKAPETKKHPTGSKHEFAVPVNRPPRMGTKPKPQAGTKPLKAKTAVTLKSEIKATTADKPLLLKTKTDSENAIPDVIERVEVESKSGNHSENTAQSKITEDDKENVPAIAKSDLVTSNTPSASVKCTDNDVDNEYNPKLSTGSETAVEAFSDYRLNVIDIDVDDWNPLLVQVYIKEIYDYVFSLEKKYPVRIRYLEGRPVNSRMRAVLLDWLIEVHAQFGFMPETLYLSAKILDRYLQADRNITRKQLQLVGVTAMYIAAKYEEVCTPAVQDFAAVSDNAFTVQDVIKMEADILKTISFDIAFPPAVMFLRRFSKAANAPMSIHSMAKYIMELSIVDYAACHLFPSEQAAGSLALALLILENKSLVEVWNPTVQHYSRHSLEAIKPIVSLLAGVLSRAQDESTKLKAVYSKYARKRLNHISKAPELEMDTWKNRVLKEVCKV